LRSRSGPIQQAERQLAAIVAGDIAGYSRLMGADEEGTLVQLKACRRELIDPGIARHRGRIVKTTGDGLLIEFSSPVAAVRCVVEIQQGMIDRNADVPDPKRICFRVGINLGDVIVDDKDLYGDAVNIAARLETLSEPGGICISHAVHEQIRDRLALPFADGGEQSVKNITRPVGVYGLSADAIAALPRAELAGAPRPLRPLHRLRNIAAAVLAGVLILAGGTWWLRPSIVPPKVPRLSIVVLPFANISNDSDQQYFADGITEDLTTDLSRIEDSFVISRNTATTYKDKPVNAKQIGQELGVRYVLEGSVQRSGKQIRVNAQLIDAATDAHVWAERFEHDIGDVFALQNEITSRLARALNLQLVIAEATRLTANPDARDYILRGRATYYLPVTRNRRAEAIAWFERALELDPHSVEAQSWLARTLVNSVLLGVSDTEAADIARAQELIAQALAVSPGNLVAHFAKGLLMRVQRRCEETITEFEMVIAADRNAAGAIALLGSCKSLTGAIDAQIPAEEQAIRLSPRDPLISIWYTRIGESHLLRSRIDEAIVWFEKARGANPAAPYAHGRLAAAYALNGEGKRASAELAEARRLSRDDRYSSIARLKTIEYFGVPKVLALYDATLFAGLRKAGMSEE
jgi:TolB-like protein/class 3 adenylate cyclase